VLIYGVDEVKAGVVKLRDTATRTETTIPAPELASHLLALARLNSLNA
jgi:histidyl-tRNA synthetase